MRSTLRWVTFFLKAIVTGLAIAFVIVYLKPELMLGLVDPSADAPFSGLTAVSSYSDAVKKSAPAVVNIYAARRAVEVLSEEAIARGEAPRSRTEGKVGSGVVASEEGYIVTNNHVIQGAEEVLVQLYDGRRAAASVVGSDPDTDLAVLRIDLPDLPSLSFGSSDKLLIGDVVLAIGNPYGLTHTVTQGIVSATGRGQLGVLPFENFIQTDAAINVGNSGGALVNSRGQLIGVNTAILDSIGTMPEGIGFAIPVSLVRGVMTQIIEHGRVVRGWLGVQTQTLNPTRAEALGLGGVSGIELVGIYSDSPAARAGLRLGDIITHINGQALRARYDALTLVANSTPGESVEIVGVRGTDTFKTQVIVAERPAAQLQESRSPG